MGRLVGYIGEPYAITITTGIDDPGLFHVADQFSRHLCDGAAVDRGRFLVELWRVCGLVFRVDGRAGGDCRLWATAALGFVLMNLNCSRMTFDPGVNALW